MLVICILQEFLCVSKLQSVIFFSHVHVISNASLHRVSLHLIDSVYNGQEFILICSFHYLRYPLKFSSKTGVEFIPAVIYASKLSSFYYYHQTPNTTIVIETLPCSYKHFPMQTSLFPWIFYSIARQIFLLFPTTNVLYLSCDNINLALLCMCKRSLSKIRGSRSLL